MPVVAAFVTSWLVADIPGVAVAAVAAVIGVNLRRRFADASVRRHAIIGSAVLTGIGGIMLAGNAWPGDGYAGFEWPLQLVLTGSLVLAAFAQWLPSQRRAGSSTKA